MKKVILLSFCYLQLIHGVAQNGKYIPFPSNMVIYGYSNSKVMPYPEEYKSSRVEIGGDTILNGLHYSKYYNFEKCVGGIRNDVPAKKVYLYSFDKNTEQLLYDFDLAVGDTVFKANGYGFFPYILQSPTDQLTIDTAWVFRIDSILMPHDGLYHKRFNFKATITDHYRNMYALANSDSTITTGEIGVKLEPLVEGVGELYNPISFFHNNQYYVWRLYYYCVLINGKALVATVDPVTALGCHTLYTDIDEKKGGDQIRLYPNPSSGKLQLSTTLSKNNYFEIYNILGDKILRSKIENEQINIDLSSALPGIYFIKIVSEMGTVLTKKIIIQ